ncbi:MAG: aldo/keto reductase [Candidatus Krumholzibacteriia bacterium]
MRSRKLGKTGLTVSEISFGAWQLGNRQDFEPMDDGAAVRLVAEALDQGINLFDTAPHYAGSASERLLGEALQGRRGEVVLVTKFGHTLEGSKDFGVERFWDSLHASLRRLRTDHVDVLLLHDPDTSMYDGRDPLWAALAAAREQGKIGHYGASLDLAAEAVSCLTHTDSDVLEIFFNILHQDVRRAFPLIAERNVGTIVKIPLDSGWLTGRYGRTSRFSGVRARWSPEQIAARADLVDQLARMFPGERSLAGFALAYILSYPEVSCVIPGVRTRGQLAQNLQASGRSLTGDERRRLEEFWNEVTDGGSRLLPW